LGFKIDTKLSRGVENASKSHPLLCPQSAKFLSVLEKCVVSTPQKKVFEKVESQHKERFTLPENTKQAGQRTPGGNAQKHA
jgi:hypothetical protein